MKAKFLTATNRVGSWPRLAAALLVSAGPGRALRAADDSRLVEGGLVRGVAGSLPGVIAYKGIPFAAPPVGDLRWRAPQPVRQWTGIFSADHFGPAGVQLPEAVGSFNQRNFFPGAPLEQSEDCLYLNVWLPTGAATRRPVMVWFYGGGMVEGAASQPLYDGSAFAKRGVVFVSFNYRLGIFGSFAHRWLSAELPRKVSGNYVILDQIAALTWVKRNIAAFGGDPENVTAFGESAGGASINRLLATPLARGLFRRVILESSQILMSRDSKAKLAEMEQRGADLAAAAGAHSLAELRALPSAKLLELSSRFRFRPNIDGVVIPELAVDVFDRGEQQAVPMLIGCNGQEGSFGPTRSMVFRAEAAARYGAKADQFFRLFPSSTDSEAARAKCDERSAQSLAAARSEARGQSRLGRPTFLYYFTRKPPGPERERYGSFHGAELPYVFNTQDALARPWEPVDRRLADLMIAYWVNFATEGNPNGPGLPAWPRFGDHEELALGLGESVSAVPFPDAPRMDFLEPFIRRDAH